jgi:hypothetical protein
MVMAKFLGLFALVGGAAWFPALLVAVTVTVIAER